MIPSQPCQQWQPDGPDLVEPLKANRQLHHALGHKPDKTARPTNKSCFHSALPERSLTMRVPKITGLPILFYRIRYNAGMLFVVTQCGFVSRIFSAPSRSPDD